MQGCLQVFDAHDCKELTDITGLQSLQHLRFVNLSGCSNLQYLGNFSSTFLSELHTAGMGSDVSALPSHFKVSGEV